MTYRAGQEMADRMDRILAALADMQQQQATMRQQQAEMIDQQQEMRGQQGQILAQQTNMANRQADMERRIEEMSDAPQDPVQDEVPYVEPLLRSAEVQQPLPRGPFERAPVHEMDARGYEIEQDPLPFEDEPARGQSALQRHQSVFASYLRAQVPVFEGTGTPDDAEQWINRVIKVLQMIRAPRDAWLDFVEYSLGKFAESSWEAIRLEMRRRGHVPTWEDFESTFRSHFLSSQWQESQRRLFAELTQGPMRVRQYFVRYTELSRYQPAAAAFPKQNLEKFLLGMRVEVQEKLAGLHITSIAEATDAAEKFEDIKERHFGRLSSETVVPQRSSGPTRRPFQQQRSAQRFHPSGSTSSGSAHSSPVTTLGGALTNRGTSAARPSESQGSRRTQSAGTATKPIPAVQCFTCRQWGHYRSQCPQASGAPRPQPQPSQHSESFRSGNSNFRRPQRQEQSAAGSNAGSARQGQIHAITQEHARSAATVVKGKAPLVE